MSTYIVMVPGDNSGFVVAADYYELGADGQLHFELDGESVASFNRWSAVLKEA